MSKKNYIENVKVNDQLTESALKNFKDRSIYRKSILKEFDGIDYKIETIGKISNMKYNKNFEEIVLEELKKINSRIDILESFHKEEFKKINSRLDVLESFHKEDFKKQKI